MLVTREKMITHAKEHGLYIHPSVTKDWDVWLKKTNDLGHCPCNPREPECPCERSVEQCISGRRGACSCTVFVSSRYIKKYSYTLGLKEEEFYKPE